MPGYFPPDSMLRRVHQERAVGLLYGQRALCVGAAHPLNYVATAINSSGRREPFGRLARTAELIEIVFFAERQQADKTLAVVNAIHRGVRGTLPVNAGRYPVGTPYSALDPQLLMWTISVMADSAQRFYELLVHPLSHAEKEAFWQDYLRFGELFAMPRETAPATYPDFRDWWADQLRSGQLQLTDEARQTGYATAFEIPMPPYAAHLKRAHNALMLGSLPPEIRTLYGMKYTTEDAASFDRVIAALRWLRKRSPRRLREGPNTRFFRWVARTERQRIKQGKPTPRLAVPDAGA